MVIGQRCESGVHEGRTPPLATLSLVMLNTQSAAACTFACLSCAVLALAELDEPGEGYEIRRMEP